MPNKKNRREFLKIVGAENIKTGTLVTEINQRAGVVTVKTATDSYKAAAEFDKVICKPRNTQNTQKN